MTALKDQLIRRIHATGPIPLSDYMSECLLHPTLGYYTNARVFGAAGDFTTAPEISQMFGELLGLAVAGTWMEQGCPSGAILAELGPGRGTLMADALRAIRRVPGFMDSVRVRLIEASPLLRKIQQETLRDFPARWSENLSDLPEAPLYLIANEFFDALPIRQFSRDTAGWREVLVAADGDHLVLTCSDATPIPALSARLKDTAPGDIVELRPSLQTWVTEIAGRIARNGGAAFIVDYGDWHSRGDTFQALSAHRSVDPLAEPGKADLTAHVDFEAISMAAKSAGAEVSEMTPQGVFLERLGITARAQALADAISDPGQLEAHIAAHRRLTHPEEMGSLFKVIAIHPPAGPVPFGFKP